MTFEKWLFDFQLTLHKEEILKFTPLFLAVYVSQASVSRSEQEGLGRGGGNWHLVQALHCYLHKTRQDYPAVITLWRGKQVGERVLLSFVWLNCMLLWAVWLEGLKLLLITLPFKRIWFEISQQGCLPSSRTLFFLPAPCSFSIPLSSPLFLPLWTLALFYLLKRSQSG